MTGTTDELKVVSEPLGGGALARAALAGATPEGWYTPRLASASDWLAHIARVRETTANGWLDALQPAIAARGAARARLEAVAQGRGVVVTTGQQAGLFGGPIYTFSKALGALAFADALEAATGVPTAPVFWAATDDADFAEASVTHVAVPGGVETLQARRVAPEGTIMARAPLGDVSGMLDGLARGAGAARYREALEAAMEAHRAEATVGGAYVALLRRLLEPLGIAVLDAGHPATRAAAFPHLREALRRSGEIDRALAERSSALRAAGFDPQVTDVAGLSLVFDGLEGTKRRVRLDEASTIAAHARPGELSANVLLRPVIERCLLPTVAYLAGPGELAYFAQTSAVAQACGLSTPHVVPRWSGTILEPHVQRILARYALQPDDLRDPHAAERRLASRALPPTVRGTLDALRQAADDAARTLGSAPDAAALLPPAVADGLRRQIAHRLERLERRYRAAVARRDEAMTRDLATARGSLWPLGKRQERTLNFIPFLARYGEPLPRLMLAEARRHADALVSPEAVRSAPRAEGAAR